MHLREVSSTNITPSQRPATITDRKKVTVFDSSNVPQPFLDTALLERIKRREKAERETAS
jgi:hypothetical protein